MAAKSRGAKRLMQELAQMESDPPADFTAAPLESDMFHWHFTIRLKNDEFAGGMYHGRIMLPPEYPLRPPEIYLMTPNGRFELNKRVCLSITGYHEDQWSPSWGIRLALTSLSAFFSTEAKGAIGGLDTPAVERRRLAKLSPDWTCPVCKQSNAGLLADRVEATQAAPAVELPPPAATTASVQEAHVGPSAESAPPAPEVATTLPPHLQYELTGTLPHIPGLDDPTIVASALTPSPPTWLDRLIVILLVTSVGFIVRRIS